MDEIKAKRSAFRQMVFSYLIVSKALYYFEMIGAALLQGGFWAVSETILTRLLTRDLLIILIILITFNTDKLVPQKIAKNNRVLNQVIVHTIDYILYMGIMSLYFWGTMFFGLFEGMNWRIILINLSALYVIILVAIESKKYMKKKEMTAYTHVLNKDEKLAMLKTLFDNDVLTLDEYDSKKEKVLGVL